MVKPGQYAGTYGLKGVEHHKDLCLKWYDFKIRAGDGLQDIFLYELVNNHRGAWKNGEAQEFWTYMDSVRNVESQWDPETEDWVDHPVHHLISYTPEDLNNDGRS